MALLPSTEEFQPEIVPSSVANRNVAGFPVAISKAGVELKTCPVGEDRDDPEAGAAILTTRAVGEGNGWPVVL